MELLPTTEGALDFVKVKTKEHVHGLHPYPARMIPQIAQKLIEVSIKESCDHQLIVDPFCGSGTVLTEAILANHQAIGIDINPLAVLLAKVRSNPISLSQRFPCGVMSKIKNEKNRYSKNKHDKELIQDATYWFKEDVVQDLLTIKKVVFEDIWTVDQQNFLKCCLSKTARLVSNIYHSGDTYVKRMKDERLQKHNPNTFQIFERVLIENTNRMNVFSTDQSSMEDNKATVLCSDAQAIPIGTKQVDLVVTSPPYGEERNTIAYSRWSRISAMWLDLKMTTLGEGTLGRTNSFGPNTHNEAFSDDISKIPVLKLLESKDTTMANLVRAFLEDYTLALREIQRILKTGCYAAIVIGNRSSRGIRLDLDLISQELAALVGLKHIQTAYRNIPTKAIPRTCALGDTISRENLIIFEKN